MRCFKVLILQTQKAFTAVKAFCVTASYYIRCYKKKQRFHKKYTCILQAYKLSVMVAAASAAMPVTARVRVSRADMFLPVFQLRLLKASALRTFDFVTMLPALGTGRLLPYASAGLAFKNAFRHLIISPFNADRAPFHKRLGNFSPRRLQDALEGRARQLHALRRLRLFLRKVILPANCLVLL